MYESISERIREARVQKKAQIRSAINHSSGIALYMLMLVCFYVNFRLFEEEGASEEVGNFGENGIF